MKTRLVVSSRQTWLIRMTTLTCMIALPTLAHAHGAMGPDELGPPLGTAGLLGFVSYWVVMLWPSARGKASRQARPGDESSAVELPPRPRRRKPPRAKRIAHLRKVQAGVQFSGDQPVRRKASDG
jgi:hypothetical protein